MGVDKQIVDVEWSETGVGKAPYQVVSIYSDAETQPYLKKHVYFFVLKEGEPMVLVTQQNQGNEENAMCFSETKNAHLKEAFPKIMNGESPTMIASNQVRYENSKLLAAKVLIKEFNMTEERLSSYIEGVTTLTLRTESVSEIWSTGVYLPQEVTYISASPMSGGMVTYHNNGDGTVTVYPVPSHYQDHDWDDLVKGTEKAREVIAGAHQVTISDIPDSMAQPLADFMSGDV